MELGTTATSHHLLLQQNPEWFDVLVRAYPGDPGILTVKLVFLFELKVLYRKSL